MAERKTFQGIPRSQFPGAQSRTVDALINTLEVITGQKGGGLDRAVTFRDVKDGKLDGLIVSGGSGGTGGGGSTGGGPLPGVDTPHAPANLQAWAAIYSVQLTWDAPTYAGHKMTRVYRAPANDFGLAVEIATVDDVARRFIEQVPPDTEYWYWIRFVNQNDVDGPLSGTSGVYARTQQSPTELLKDEVNWINQSALAADLVAKIELIDTHSDQIALIDSELAAADTRLTDGLAQLDSELAVADTRLTDGLAQLDTELTALDARVVAAANALGSRITAEESATAAAAVKFNSLGTWNGTKFSIIAGLETTTSTHATRLASLGTWNGTDYSRISSLETTNSSQATSISNLTTRMGTAESSITSLNTTTAGQATSISNLTTRMGTAESDITSLETTTSTHATRLASLGTWDGTNYSRISSLETTNSSQATSISNLTTRMGSAESSITSLNTTTAGQATSINNLTTRMGSAESSITSLNTTTSTHATRLASLGTWNGTDYSRISSLETTNSSQATSISNLTTRMGSAESSITSLNTTTANQATQINQVFTKATGASYALAVPAWTGSQSVPQSTTYAGAWKTNFTIPSTLNGKPGVLRVLINDAEGFVRVAYRGVDLGSCTGADNQDVWYEFPVTVVTGANEVAVWASGADGAYIKRIEVRAGELVDGIAAIETKSNTAYDLTAGASAQYTIKVQAGAGGANVIAGIGLMASTGSGSEVIIAADKFAVVNPNFASDSVAYKPFVYDSTRNRVVVESAAIVNLTAEQFVGGRVIADALAVNQFVALPAGSISTDMLDPSFLSSLVRRNNSAVESGGTWNVPFSVVNGTVSKAGVIRGASDDLAMRIFVSSWSGATGFYGSGMNMLPLRRLVRFTVQRGGVTITNAYTGQPAVFTAYTRFVNSSNGAEVTTVPPNPYGTPGAYLTEKLPSLEFLCKDATGDGGTHTYSLVVAVRNAADTADATLPGAPAGTFSGDEPISAVGGVYVSTAWNDISGKPATATRWPQWNEISGSTLQTLPGAGASGGWGSLSISGNKGGFTGVHFPDSGHYFMFRTTSSSARFGIHDGAAWKVSWDDNGALYHGTVGWGRLTGVPDMALLSGASFTGTVNGPRFNATTEFQFDGKRAIGGTNDAWLRLNPANDFTNGIYCGSSVVRTDGSLQVGASGGSFLADVNGAFTSGRMRANGGSSSSWGTDGNGAFAHVRANDSHAHWLITSNVADGDIRSGIQVLNSDTGHMRFYTNKRGAYVQTADGGLTLSGAQLNGLAGVNIQAGGTLVFEARNSDKLPYAKSHMSGAMSPVMTWADFRPNMAPPAGLENTITTNWLAAGAVTANIIAANSINASHMTITDYTNLITNGIGESTEGWEGNISTLVTDVLGTERVFTIWGRDRYFGNRFPVTAGDQFYCAFMSVPVGGGVGNFPVRLGLHFVNSVGATIAWTAGAVRGTGPIGGVLASRGVVTAPPGAVAARIWLQIDTTGTSQANGDAFRVSRLEMYRRNNGNLIVDGAITANKIAAGSITADKIEAGSITGDRIQAGTSITSPIIRGGRAELVGANAMKVSSATAFGPDNLIYWFGPKAGLVDGSGNPNLALLTKANATNWEDGNGGAYFGGQLSAGTLSNAATSTVKTAGSYLPTVDLGPFSTNGRQKTVVVSVDYHGNRTSGTSIPMPTSAPTGTVVLERSINGGTSWTTLTTRNVTGSYHANNEPGSYAWNEYLSTSFTTVDTSTSTADFMYRARFTAFSRFASSTSYVANQYIGVRSTEV